MKMRMTLVRVTVLLEPTLQPSKTSGAARGSINQSKPRMAGARGRGLRKWEGLVEVGGALWKWEGLSGVGGALWKWEGPCGRGLIEGFVEVGGAYWGKVGGAVWEGPALKYRS